jgi:hypothetical protein
MITCIKCNKQFSGTYYINGKKHRLRCRNKCIDCLPLQPAPKPSMQLSLICKNCNTKFTRVKAKHKGKNAFCNNSCAAQYNNKLYPKRNKIGKPCTQCNKEHFSRNLYCDYCKENRKIDNKPLSFFQKRKDSNRYAPVREHARKTVKNKPQKCYICGYKKHVQVAHKRSISDFPPNTLIIKVNHPSNLYLLCPNHHWELDHKLLHLD